VFHTVFRKDQDLLNPVGADALKSSNDVGKNVFSFNYEANTLNNRLTTNLFFKLYQQELGSSSYSGTVVDGVFEIREDKLSNKRFNNGYGVAASYKLFPRIILITSAERAVRMPEEEEIFGSPDRNVLPNTSLEPEVSDNYNAGFRLGTFNLGRHKISLSGNVFWRNVKGRIMPRANELINNQEIELTQYINLGLAQSLGFEGELSYIYKDNLTMMFNFSRFNSLFKQEFDPATGQKMTYYNTQIPNEPFFTVNGNVHYRLNNILQKSSQLSLFYTLGYVAPFKTVWPESDWFITPPQYAQNVGLSYRFPDRKVIVSLDVKNIFNAELYDKFGVQKPGIGYYLKLNYTINKF
jgi:outer membrane receptor protein involved in Fe transport